MRTSMMLWAWTIALGGFAAAWAGEKDDPKASEPKSTETKSVYDFTMKDIDGKDKPLRDYAGNVLIIVNVASQCGYTDGHYKTLQPLYEKYKDRGLRILAFPANNFGKQEPGSDSEIREFCSSKYHVSFDLFSKISVAGEDQCDLYKHLTNHPNEEIAGKVPWNFTKYLIDREGNVVAKFSPKVSPSDKVFVDAVEAELAKASPQSEPRENK